MPSKSVGLSLRHRSRSRQLSKEFITTWQTLYAEDTITYRDLRTSPIPHVTEEWIAADYTPLSEQTSQMSQTLQLSNDLVNKFLASDRCVFGVPMYNFSVPSSFKAYIDYMVRVGRTFAIEEGAFKGLVKDKKIVFITARGDRYSKGSPLAGWDAQEPSLRYAFQCPTLLVICLGLSGVLAYNLFFFLGFKNISASRAGLIIALNPVCITVASRIFFQEKLTYFKSIGVALSLFAAILIITKRNISILLFQGIDRGELSILGCVISWVVYSLVGKLVMQEFSALVTTTYAIWVGTVLLLPFAIWEQNNRLPDIDIFTGLGLAYLGILATVIAFNWYYQGIKEIGAAKAAIFINLVPVFAIIFGTIFLQESLSAIAFFGGGLVILGVSLVNRHNA